MIDYVCLKLGKLTDDLLDEVYDDLMRKFNTYRIMDGIQASTPIVAYPVMSEEGGRAAKQRITAATDKLYDFIGYKDESGIDMSKPILPEEDLQRILEQSVGAPLIDIEELIKDM